MECKGLSFFRSNSVVTVLIETLWNVKHKMDTGIPGALRRINRNIVECKVVNVPDSSSQTASINRNIVECKDRKECEIYVFFRY